jgi:hypothetical protein
MDISALQVLRGRPLTGRQGWYYSSNSNLKTPITMPPLADLLRASKDDTRALRLAAFTPADIDWVLYAGLGPILHRATGGASGAATQSPAGRALASADLTSRILIGNILDAASEILDAAPALAQETILLKGVPISLRYPEPHLRTMGDIDLLAPTGAQRELETVLRNLGYRQQSEYPAEFYEKLHHSMPFYQPQRRIWVEVHTRLFPPASHVGRDPVFSDAHVRSQAVACSFRGTPALQLSDELQIAYISAHWGRNFNQQRGLIPLLDLLQLLKNGENVIDWDSLLGWLHGSHSAAHVHVMLGYLARHHLITLPPATGARLASMQTGLNGLSVSILHRLMDRYLMQGKHFGGIGSADNISIIWKSLLAPGSAWGNLASVPWNLAFPPRHRQRFNPAFQLGRLASFLGLRR